MSQQVNLKAKGLFTYDNQLSSIPEGALLEATNILINRLNTIESRRGYKVYGNSFGNVNTRAKQLLKYKNRILRHYDDKIQFDSDNAGTFLEFDGNYSEPESGIRIKFKESAGNFYFTTNKGIKKISARTANDFSTNSGYILDAGAPKAIEISGVMNYINVGFFTEISKVGYRVVWGYKDINNNLILGGPSPRVVITNTSEDTSGTVDLTINVPNDITVNHFYQIYRTALVQKSLGQTFEDIDPGDEHYLIYEGNPTESEITSQEINYNDVTPDDFRAAGALLYTNPISGQGIQQANEIPPLAKDIEVYKNNMFFANTKTRHKLYSSLITIDDFENALDITDISVSDPTIITTASAHELITGDVVYIYNSDSTPVIDGQYEVTVLSSTTFSIPIEVTVLGTAGVMTQIPQILISNGVTSQVYGFRGVTEETEITTVAEGSLGTSPNFSYFLINSHSNYREYFFWFDNTVSGDGEAPSGNNDLIGKIPVRVRVNPGDTADQVADALNTRLNEIGVDSGDFFSEVNTNILSISHNFNGIVDDAVDGNNPTGFTITIPVKGIGEDFGSNLGILSNISSVSLQVDQTARSLVENINKSGIDINSYYISGPSDVPGQFTLEKASIADEEFYIATLTDRITDNFNSVLPKASVITGITTGDITPVITTKTDHGFVLGDEVYITDVTSNPSIIGKHIITDVPSSTEFEITIPSLLVTATASGYTFKPLNYSDNEEKPNRVYYSKSQQFEAVPELNYFDVGPQDEPIERIVALRDSLFIYKTDGVYRLSGESENNFGVTLFDKTSKIVAPDSAAVLNNGIMVLTSDGVSITSDTGITIISRPIQEDVNLLVSSQYENQRTSAFGIGYESDKLYLLFLNESTSSEVAEQCLVYNYFTESWTKFDISKSCGIVGADNKLYFGAGDINYTEIERKDFNRSDYADREYDINMSNDAILLDENLIEVSSTSNTTVGDTVEQTQYLTISEFNRLLKKLDFDPTLDDSDYFSSLGMTAGDNLTLKMDSLVNKLNIDDGITTYVFSGSSDFATIQIEFNQLIDDLNLSAGIFYSNYQQSSGTKKFETIITAVNKGFNEIIVDYVPQFIVGPLVVYKAIQSTVIWAPQFLGDPSAYKQFREGTFLFLNKGFYGCTVSYKSDLSGNFENVDFIGQGNGVWGGFYWGESVWGGEANQDPIRTLIPRNKQRCRYLFCKFQHTFARDKYLILGVSLTGEMYSSKAYR